MSPADPRPGWVRQRTRELHQTGLRWIDARKQAEAEADVEFADENGANGDNGNGATA
jgi:hypothetical protein